MAFLLVLVGYGTKAGLAPMHTWLPDAHSEGPAPVSAMLSGALLNTAMLGVARFLTITDAASSSLLPRTVLVAFGAFSLFVAALFIVRQQGIKRLMAYSSVEHMGVLALGLRIWRPARHCCRAVSHAQPFAEQVVDVLRRWKRDARVRHQGHG